MPAVNDIAPIYADEQGGGDDLYLPRTRPKKDTRSKLMKSKAAAGGLIVNACPFGCEDHELDAEMYCRHLVGFTDPSNDRCTSRSSGGRSQDGRGPEAVPVRGRRRPAPVQAGDQLVRSRPARGCTATPRQTRAGDPDLEPAAEALGRRPGRPARQPGSVTDR
jgi:hypothetical protein